MTASVEYLVFAIFEEEESAAIAAKAIKETAKGASIHIDGLASVHRDQHGWIHLHEIGDVTGSQGAVRGALAGALLGLIFPPAVLASAVMGSAIGGIVAKFHDLGFKTQDLHSLGESLASGQSAVIFVGDEEAQSMLGGELENAQVFHRSVAPELEQHVIALETAAANPQ